MPCNSESNLRDVENCIDSIKLWMNSTMRKLIDSKTEALLMGTQTNREKVSVAKIRIGQSDIQFSDKVKNNGVLFDNNLSMEVNINAV